MRFHSAQGCVRFFRVYVVLPAAVLLMAGLSVTSGDGQIAGNTARDIRPLVQIETTPSIPTAVGIFDTGGTSLFIPPETNSRFNIAVAKNTAAGASANYGVVGNATNFYVGGFLGGAFDGPEVMTAVGAIQAGIASPTHVYTGYSNGNTKQFTRTGISANLTDSNTAGNAAYSEPNIGAGFYNGDGAGQALAGCRSRSDQCGVAAVRLGGRGRRGNETRPGACHAEGAGRAYAARRGDFEHHLFQS